MAKQDKELESYRNLMEVPDTFEEGFKLSSLMGAIFVAMIMVPGAIYMELIAGMGVGPAAQWVTVILFIEIAKRANQNLSRAQIFILYYMAGSIVSASSEETLLFTQFLVQSDAAASFGIASQFPNWKAPIEEDVLAVRSFFQWAWMPALALFVFKKFFEKLDTAVLGYGLFRITNDIEKLPFPLAPIGAAGIMALSDDLEGKSEDSWRWRVFSIGGAIGLIFGAIYMGLPAISGAFLTKSLSVFPIPFVDWSEYTQEFLPAVATGLSFDLSNLILGMVMPFFAVIGSAIGLLVTFILNPILYYNDKLPSWDKNQETLEIMFNNNIDFYLSFTIGISAAVAIVGFMAVFRRSKAPKPGEEIQTKVEAPIPEGRGDIPKSWILICYLLSCAAIIALSGYLLDWHAGVMAMLVFYAFFYTPIISYVTARLEGLAGQVVEIPYIREISFILSGYHGVAIWFIPIPKGNYGVQTVFYKQAELTGTRFSSIWKADLVLFPIIILALIGFSSYIWSLEKIPSYVYPFAEEMWEFQAKNACVVFSSTLGEYSIFYEAIKPNIIYVGLGAGLLSFWGLAVAGAPTLLCYGVVRGLGQSMPHAIIPNLIGALIGRYYFEKKFGLVWRQYVPVLSAGFFCGAGLVSMLCIGIVFLSKSASSLPF